jgi:hypothetical protein
MSHGEMADPKYTLCDQYIKQQDDQVIPLDERCGKLRARRMPWTPDGAWMRSAANN